MTGKAAVVLASAGRPALLAGVVADVDAQTYDALAARVLSVPDAASLPAETGEWTIVTGTRGLAAQRNAGTAVLDDDIDAVFFFDDDAVVRADYVQRGMEFFAAHPGVVALTGRVLLDGAAHSGAQISEPVARRAVEDSARLPPTGAWTPSRTLYGCNFAFRRSAVPQLRFDDRLPLYSWLEDHDFARRAMRSGDLAIVDDCVIVHRGAESGGRASHRRLGYSQFMNPVYLHHSGSFPLWLAAWEIFRPTAKNLAYSVAGPQRGWRRERVRGNALAVADAIRGRITPERILSL